MIDHVVPLILIIDDHIDNIRLTRKYLNEQGFEVMIARHGLVGLERARQVQPNLILLDIIMPELDGFETCSRLKADPTTAHIPIIFMTAVDNIVDKVRGFELGGVDYVTKPVQVTELVARVKAHLQIVQLQQTLQYNNQMLEQRVAERTAELQAEITQRIQYQQEKDKLLEVVLQQSQRLQELTQFIITSQQAKYQVLSQSMEQQLCQDLELLGVIINRKNAMRNSQDPLPHEAQQLLQRIYGYVNQTQASLNEAIINQEHLLQDPSLQLTVREQEVLHLLVDGKSNSLIADLLNISVSTVQTYRQRIMKKLNVTKFTDLVKLVTPHTHFRKT